MAEMIWNAAVSVYNFIMDNIVLINIFSAQIPADCLDMAAFALFYTDPRICYVFDHRTGFPQEQDV
jgi:hypothetical protein